MFMSSTYEDGAFFERPADAPEAQPDLRPDNHRIGIAFRKYGPKGTYYRVSYRGKALIESTREPVYSACRALVAMGLKGRLEVWGGEPYPRGIVRDIKKGAKLTVVEKDTIGPRLARYRPPANLRSGDNAHAWA
jgi:hypothetical protein